MFSEDPPRVVYRVTMPSSRVGVERILVVLAMPVNAKVQRSIAADRVP